MGLPEHWALNANAVAFAPESVDSASCSADITMAKYKTYEMQLLQVPQASADETCITKGGLASKVIMFEPRLLKATPPDVLQQVVRRGLPEEGFLVISPVLVV